MTPPSVASTAQLIAAVGTESVRAGEQVRWLPRRRASDLALPGNDFWVFDERTIRFGYFAGDGELVGHEVCRDPDVFKLCLSAFEAVWDRAIPHEDYQPLEPPVNGRGTCWLCSASGRPV